MVAIRFGKRIIFGVADLITGDKFEKINCISRNSILQCVPDLSDRVLVSDAVRQRSFSPLPLAWHPRMSASGFCRSTSVPDVAAPHCIP
jgi:hypothetical protein